MRSCRECERDEVNCSVPLSLEPPARQAFADREAKLVAHEKWPLQRWYNDEDFCRAYNTACEQADEAERLRALVAKLPVTADGAQVVLGMTVYFRARASSAEILSAVVERILLDADGVRLGFGRSCEGLHAEDCYSTRAAASAAGGEA